MSTQPIINGPSKFDLMLALFDDKHHRVVSFSLRNPDEICQVYISQVGKEDGSGESWLFQGVSDHKPVSGWFRTDTRQGCLKKG